MEVIHVVRLLYDCYKSQLKKRQKITPQWITSRNSWCTLHDRCCAKLRLLAPYLTHRCIAIITSYRFYNLDFKIKAAIRKIVVDSFECSLEKNYSERLEFSSKSMWLVPFLVEVQLNHIQALVRQSRQAFSYYVPT